MCACQNFPTHQKQVRKTPERAVRMVQLALELEKTGAVKGRPRVGEWGSAVLLDSAGGGELALWQVRLDEEEDDEENEDTRTHR